LCINHKLIPITTMHTAKIKLEIRFNIENLGVLWVNK
jgi:hypothetical protein